jgi:hypothetical protein
MTAAAPVAIPATDPFTAVAAHFGMLLGVDDLETIIGQPWAKMRLHNAWLHGAGVVWGGAVSVDAESREVRVEPFLALDALGHELTIGTESCLDLKAWYDANADAVEHREVDGRIVFDAVVVAHYRACLAKPVPTLISPCDGGAADTAFSRVRETAELFLLPAAADVVPPRAEHYPRLRLLRGLPSTLTDPERADLLAQADAARAEADPAEALLTVWRAAAAADVAERHPTTEPGADPLYDATEPAYVVLARLNGLSLTTGDPVTAGVQSVDIGARISQVDTATLAELCSGGAAAAEGGDAGGPRVVAGSEQRAGDAVTVELTAAVAEPTLGTGVAVRRYDDAAGWVDASGGAPTLAGSTLTIPLAAGIDPAAVLRVVLYGTGPAPLVGVPAAGQRPVPFAGVTGGPPAGTATGADAELMIGGAA